MRTLYIHANNVHSGGGSTLLKAMLDALPDGLSMLPILDERASFAREQGRTIPVKSVRPTLLGRLCSEWWLYSRVKKNDLVLCFGNLPPLFRLRCRSAVFLQNRLLLATDTVKDFNWKTQLRLRIERLWLRTRSRHVSFFCVQSHSMRVALEKQPFAQGKKILVLPFLGKGMDAHADGDDTYKCDFLYVASGEPHKNHRALIDGWKHLAAAGHFPTLTLTIDRQNHGELCSYIEDQAARHRLEIQNLGTVPSTTIARLYGSARALIYPSKMESFGLPLLEAERAGLPIVAAELDYVRDVVDPVETFDPGSGLSIARAAERFLGYSHTRPKIRSAHDFISEVVLELSSQA